MVDVYLNLPSFLTMVSASAEVYHDEAVGYLVGYPANKRFIVEYAVPYQYVDTSDHQVYLDVHRVSRINRVIARFSEGMEIIGTFHSHAGRGKSKAVPLPSDADINNTLPDQVSLIVALNPKLKELPWTEGKNTIYGTVENLHVEIGGFVRIATGRGWQKIHVNCSGVTGIPH